MIDYGGLRDPLRYARTALPGRRGVLAGLSGGIAGLVANGLVPRAFAADTLTVADPGGVWTPSADAAFIKPFEKEAGVSVDHTARQHYPTVEIKANVETKAYTWDVVIATDADVYELAPQNLLEPLDWSGDDMAQIMPEARRPGWMGSDLYCTIIAYSTAKYGKKGPANWADLGAAFVGGPYRHGRVSPLGGTAAARRRQLPGGRGCVPPLEQRGRAVPRAAGEAPGGRAGDVSRRSAGPDQSSP